MVAMPSMPPMTMARKTNCGDAAWRSRVSMASRVKGESLSSASSPHISSSCTELKLLAGMRAPREPERQRARERVRERLTSSLPRLLPSCLLSCSRRALFSSTSALGPGSCLMRASRPGVHSSDEVGTGWPIWMNEG